MSIVYSKCNFCCKEDMDTLIGKSYDTFLEEWKCANCGRTQAQRNFRGWVSEAENTKIEEDEKSWFSQ